MVYAIRLQRNRDEKKEFVIIVQLLKEENERHDASHYILREKEKRMSCCEFRVMFS